MFKDAPAPIITTRGDMSNWEEVCFVQRRDVDECKQSFKTKLLTHRRFHEAVLQRLK